MCGPYQATACCGQEHACFWDIAGLDSSPGCFPVVWPWKGSHDPAGTGHLALGSWQELQWVRKQRCRMGCGCGVRTLHCACVHMHVGEPSAFCNPSLQLATNLRTTTGDTILSDKIPFQT